MVLIINIQTLTLMNLLYLQNSFLPEIAQFCKNLVKVVIILLVGLGKVWEQSAWNYVSKHLYNRRVLANLRFSVVEEPC